eukprot:Mrub_02792.p1 GENE.Mrub_02792~~Mrub_02792.p1  ORF type:complete len:524 (-),score=89.03 Mrub_02792:42-1433(-)
MKKNGLKHLVNNEIYCINYLTLYSKKDYFPKYIESYNSNNDKNIIMEYIKGINIEKLIEKRKKFSPIEAKHFLAYTLNIIEEFHKHGFIHRDIKPNNMILSDEGKLYLLDFGSVKVHDKRLHEEFLSGWENVEVPKEILYSLCSVPKYSSQDGNTYVGTEAYQSPEVRDSQEPGYYSDMWAYGCVMVKVLTGNEAFVETEDSNTYNKTFKLNNFGHLESTELSLVTSLLNPDICERITLENVKKHPYFENIDFSNVNFKMSEIVNSYVQPSCESGGFSREFEYSNMSESQSFNDNYSKNEKTVWHLEFVENQRLSYKEQEEMVCENDNTVETTAEQFISKSSKSGSTHDYFEQEIDNDFNDHKSDDSDNTVFQEYLLKWGTFRYNYRTLTLTYNSLYYTNDHDDSIKYITLDHNTIIEMKDNDLGFKIKQNNVLLWHYFRTTKYQEWINHIKKIQKINNNYKN